MAVTLQDDSYLKALRDYVKSGLVCSARLIDKKADSIAEEFVTNGATRVYITIDISRDGSNDMDIETTYPTISEIIS